MENKPETIESLLNNDSFLAWASGSATADQQYWNHYMLSGTENKQNMDDALRLYHALKLQEVPVNKGIIQAEKDKLLNSLNAPAGRIVKFAWKKWLSVAAVFAIILTAFFIANTNSKQHIKTAYGEKTEVNLADGSSITLNSNSSVKYSSGFESKKQREVWITGEAFFSVAKTTDHKKFIVHAGKFDVIVTGTKFNVVSRENSSSVLLVEGSITLQRGNEEIAVEPGELVELSTDGNNVKMVPKKIATTEQQLAWLDKRIVLENTTLAEVAGKIKELYGVNVVFSDKNVEKKTITGILPNDNLDILLNALEATSDFDVERNGDTVNIRAQKTN